MIKQTKQTNKKENEKETNKLKIENKTKQTTKHFRLKLYEVTKIKIT